MPEIEAIKGMLQGLPPVPETMLIPLRARAAATMAKDAMINDGYAVDMLEQLGVDRPKTVSQGAVIGVAIRTQLFDRETLRFCEQHTDGVVVNLGCGLDARYLRLKPQCLWFELDVPEIMALRRLFYPETDSYRYLTASAFDDAWYNDVPADQPVLFIAEGLLMYFPEDDVKRLFKGLQSHFPQMECLWEVLSPVVAGNTQRHPDVSKTRARFRWGVADSRVFNGWAGKVVFREEWCFMEQHRSKHPWYFLLLHILWPGFRKAFRLVHLVANE